MSDHVDYTETQSLLGEVDNMVHNETQTHGGADKAQDVVGSAGARVA